MTRSDAPTSRPGAHWMATWKERLQFIAGALGVAGALWGVLQPVARRVATDDDVEAAVRFHDTSTTAHSKHQDRLDALERATGSCAADAAQVRLLWRTLVGYVAADREHDPRLQARAAEWYRDRYDSLVDAGLPPDRAFRDALSSPMPRPTDR